MASTDARPIPLKNTAYRVTFPILDADGDLVTGAAGLDSEVSKDAGTFADCTNEATEIATASGMYYLDLTAGEMNADCVAIIVKTSTSGAKTVPIVLYPEEAGDIRVNVTEVNGTAQTAGDLAAMITVVDDFIDTEVAAIKAKTDNLPPDPADASDIAAAFAITNGKIDVVDDFLDTEIAAIKAKTDNLPALPAAVGDIPTANQNADALLDRANGVETGMTPRQTLRLASSVLLGKSSGHPGSPVYRDVNDTKNRVVATVASGNRSVVTLDPT